MANQAVLKKAFASAFPRTVPILAGFLFLGMAYGVYMRAQGFSAIYPIVMSLTIFAGSMEFVAANLLLGAFDPVGALLMTLMVNARHLFYGLSMLEKYKGVGLKKLYLIFGMCDESFSINYTAVSPPDVDKGWFMFFVTLLNYIYWGLGAALGGLLGSVLTFDTTGLDFVMTALFVVIFLEHWLQEDAHGSSILGLGASLVCLALFGAKGFILPAMALIVAVLTLLRRTALKEAHESP